LESFTHIYIIATVIPIVNKKFIWYTQQAFVSDKCIPPTCWRDEESPNTYH